MCTYIKRNPRGNTDYRTVIAYHATDCQQSWADRSVGELQKDKSVKLLCRLCVRVVAKQTHEGC